MAVLRRHLPRGRGASGTLVGTVFAHRLFDLSRGAAARSSTWPLTAKVPHWAVTSLVIVSIIGCRALHRRVRDRPTGHHRPIDGARSLRRAALDGPAGARGDALATGRPLGAILLQCAGWVMQLFAVYVSMRAFDIHASMAAAGLVLLLMNVATIFPLWPGNIGLLQAAVALPLVQYGVAYSTGFAYALVLQVIEMSVGVGVGLIFLAREGLSFASLRDMPEASEVDGGRRGRGDATRPRGVVRALACPASLKGVLTAPKRRRRWPRGCAPAAPTRSSCRSPTAVRGRRTRSGSLSAATGARPTCTMRSAAPRRGSLARSPRRHRGRRGRGGGPARSRAARAAGGVEPRIRRARRRRPRGGAERARARARRHGDDGRGRGLARGRPRAARAGSRRLRRDGDPRRGAAPLRAAEGRRSRLRSPSSSAASPRAMELVSYRHKPVAGAAGGLGAALASLGAELVPGAALVLDAVGFDASALRPRRHRRGPRRRDDGARQGARRGRAAALARNALRRLRRRRRAGAAGRGDGRAVRRPGPGAGRSRRARARL